jgi:hypothetical protein
MQALIVVENITMRLEKERREKRDKLEKEMAEKGLTDEEKNIMRRCVYGIKSIFDWSNTFDKLEQQNKEDRFNMSLFDNLTEMLNSGYVFLPYQFFKACEDKLEHDKCFSTNGHFECYKLEEGETITVSAS